MVGSSFPPSAEARKGPAVRWLKRYASWVKISQNIEPSKNWMNCKRTANVLDLQRILFYSNKNVQRLISEVM